MATKKAPKKAAPKKSAAVEQPSEAPKKAAPRHAKITKDNLREAMEMHQQENPPVPVKWEKDSPTYQWSQKVFARLVKDGKLKKVAEDKTSITLQVQVEIPPHHWDGEDCIFTSFKKVLCRALHQGTSEDGATTYRLVGNGMVAFTKPSGEPLEVVVEDEGNHPREDVAQYLWEAFEAAQQV